MARSQPRSRRALRPIPVNGRCRAPPDHDHVLRSRRLYEPRRTAGCRGLAQSRRVLSRRGLDRGDGPRRPRAEKARRRADGALRLSACAGERRRTRRTRGARDPARARPRSGAPELSARIGLECGSVVVDAAGEVFGEAPNIAARVQAAAEPGTVLVTARVQRQTAGLFVVEDKGAHDLKGVPAPVALYRIVRASGGGRRGGARALTPLVGREDELTLLTRRWSRARRRPDLGNARSSAQEAGARESGGEEVRARRRGIGNRLRRAAGGDGLHSLRASGVLQCLPSYSEQAVKGL